MIGKSSEFSIGKVHDILELDGCYATDDDDML